VDLHLIGRVAGEEFAGERQQSIGEARVDVMADEIEKTELAASVIELTRDGRARLGAALREAQIDHGQRC